eukprot:GHVU01049170.1.p1 GENE.GHVU01049170.1~~GHVU01049170.1.p1  ORF type:complete len:193 (+),score=11.48 GHVU01049170.1:266-844(+)
MDSVPVLSQLRSLYQYVRGDQPGALETQIGFSRKCMVVSQIRSAVEWMKGDAETARETQVLFCKVWIATLDGSPGIGHLKGAVHYGMGDKESGDRSILLASRTCGVAGGGIVGALLAGPLGAALGGLTFGVIMDSFAVACQLLFNQKEEYQGLFGSVRGFQEGALTPGSEFDSAALVVIDSAIGLGAGVPAF